MVDRPRSEESDNAWVAVVDWIGFVAFLTLPAWAPAALPLLEGAFWTGVLVWLTLLWP